jgi:hypothetical protein
MCSESHSQAGGPDVRTCPDVRSPSPVKNWLESMRSLPAPGARLLGGSTRYPPGSDRGSPTTTRCPSRPRTPRFCPRRSSCGRSLPRCWTSCGRRWCFRLIKRTGSAGASTTRCWKRRSCRRATRGPGRRPRRRACRVRGAELERRAAPAEPLRAGKGCRPSATQKARRGGALPQERQLVCQCGWQSPRTAVRFSLLGQYQDHVLREWLKAQGRVSYDLSCRVALSCRERASHARGPSLQQHEYRSRNVRNPG